MITIKDLETSRVPDWCPGCGNFGLWQALKQALVDLKLSPDETILVAGIGCHGHMNNFTKVTSFEGLHGRPIPLATGIKIANPGLKVLISTGDGDCLGEGGNHLLHASLRNDNLTVILHNNSSYSLTTGQASPTSPSGYLSKSTPCGKISPAFNPVALTLAAGATFVARGFAGDVDHLKSLFISAISHPGFAFIDVLQPCVVFNKVLTFEFYRQHIVKLEKPFSSRSKALTAVTCPSEKIPIGVFLQEKGPSFEEKIDHLADKKITKKPLSFKDLDKIAQPFF